MRFCLPQLITALIFISCSSFSHAAAKINPESTLTESPLKYMEASELVKLLPDEFIRLTGKNLNPIERVSFRLWKHRMKRDMKKNPALMVADYFKPAKKKMSNVLLIILIAVVVLFFVFVIFAPATE